MSTTITGSLKYLTTAAKTSGVYVRVTLQGTGGNQPRVSGTGALVPEVATFSPNVSGVISGTLYSTRDAAGTGNGEIEAGGSLTAVWYKMEVVVNGTSQPAIHFHAKNGATVDISNVTPITTNPVATAPTGDTTYARLDGGNQPFTGAVSAANKTSGTLAMKVVSTGAVIYLTAAGLDANDGLSWGSAKATLSAAISALPSQGGTIYFSGTIAQNSSLTLKSNLNIIGMGSAQIDSVTGPATITTTIGSGDLFYFNAFSDCRLADFSIKNTAASGANAAIRLTAAQRNSFERIYISGAFARGVQLDSSSSAPASCIWNSFREIHVTGLAANGIALLLDSTDATNKVINSNFFYNFQATGGTSGVGIKLTNSGVHNQIINENVFFASEASATSGTAILVDNGSTRGCVFIDCNAEGSSTGLNKATSNTLTFIGGNISSNTANVTDAQPTFTVLIGTNVGGIVQSFAVTPIGGLYVDGIAVGGAVAPVSKTLSLQGSSSGNTAVQAAAVASGTLTLPVGTDTIAALAASQTLTNKALGGTGATTPDTTYNRIRANRGSALVTGDFGTLSGWGTTATVSAVTGTDGAGTVTISSSGTGQAANPSFLFTYHDGSWGTAPIAVFARNDSNAPAAAQIAAAFNTTAATFVFLNGTPVAGTTYTFSFMVVGK